jgi:hypothetical protein
VKNSKTLHEMFSPFFILQSPRMDSPPFKESVPRPHSPFFENGKKEVWKPLLFRAMTMFYRTDNILQIFLTFSLNVVNILQKTVNPAKTLLWL